MLLANIDRRYACMLLEDIDRRYASIVLADIDIDIDIDRRYAISRHRQEIC